MFSLRTLLALLLALGTAFIPLDAAAKNKPRIAVLELSGPLPAQELALLSDQIRAGVLKGLQGKPYVVMSRENMAALAQDMGIDLTCAEGQCEVETARTLGATWVVSGTLLQMGGRWMCTIKVHEVESGALTVTEKVEGKAAVDLVDLLPSVSQRLIQHATGTTAVPSGPVKSTQAKRLDEPKPTRVKPAEIPVATQTDTYTDHTHLLAVMGGWSAKRLHAQCSDSAHPNQAKACTKIRKAFSKNKIQTGWPYLWEEAISTISSDAEKKRAAYLLEIQCISGNPYACTGFGLALADRLPVDSWGTMINGKLHSKVIPREDFAKLLGACEQFRKACKGASAVGCMNLALCHDRQILQGSGKEACDKAYQNDHGYSSARNPEPVRSSGSVMISLSTGPIVSPCTSKTNKGCAKSTGWHKNLWGMDNPRCVPHPWRYSYFK